MTSQAGKNAIITGGASGIGRAIVLNLAAAGANVAVCDLDVEGATAVAELVRKEGGRAVPVQVDVSSPAAVLAAVARAREALGNISVLVCSAGIGGWSTVPQITDQLWDQMLGVNLDGPFYCARAVLPDMMDAHWGRIVNISSGAGQNGGGPGLAHYSAAKAGVLGLTKAMALEFAAMGITVNAIAPGVVDTPILKNVPGEHLEELVHRIPIGRLGRPEDIAAACAYLVSDEASYVTGQVLCPNGGFYM
jgi:2-hydroxycyclohexanecarboxyl-CoA dehydrogenase